MYIWSYLTDYFVRFALIGLSFRVFDQHSAKFVTALFAVPGLLVGVLVGWYARTRSSSSTAPSHPQQLRHVREIDRHVSSAMSSLRAYEKRLLVGTHLPENGASATTPATSQNRGRPGGSASAYRSPFREPLNGTTLLDIKRRADEHLWECTSALTRASAALSEDALRDAQDLIDTLVDVRTALEAQEADGDAASEDVRACVAALRQSRARFLATARAHLGLAPLTEEARARMDALAEQAFSPSRCPRPYMETGVRLPQERF